MSEWRDIGLDKTYKPGSLIYVNFPIPPKELIDNIPTDFDSYKVKKLTGGGFFKRSDSYSEELNEWCKKNICEDLSWDIQLLSADLHPHKDKGLSRKLTLLIDSGSNLNPVHTYFYEDNDLIDKHNFEDKINNPLNLHNLIKDNITDKFEIKRMKWHIFAVDKYHSVFGIEDGNCRISLVANLA